MQLPGWRTLSGKVVQLIRKQEPQALTRPTGEECFFAWFFSPDGL
jgi:hypothetical protein